MDRAGGNTATTLTFGAYNPGTGKNITIDASALDATDTANFVVDASGVTAVNYVTNTFTGKQFKWQNETWTSSHEGTYNPGFWRINL